jgi:small subunit ribosomal protein S18
MAEETKTAPAAAETSTSEVRRPDSPRPEGQRTEGQRPEGQRPEGHRPEGRYGSRGPRPGGPGGAREGGGGGRKYFRRKKVCKFCVEKSEAINYKDVRTLSQFVAESGKIVPRRLTGVCTPHQRRLSSAIKQARNIALLPYAGRP